MRRFQHYTTSDHEILYTLSLALLKKHNIQNNKEHTRLLTKEEEGFIAGCKGNINYGGQRQLSGKQLKRLEVLLERYVYKLDTLQKIKLKMVINKKKDDK